MGYQRDKRIEEQTHRRLAACDACHEINKNGISYMDHTCEARATRSPFSGDEIERIGPGLP